MGPCGNSAHQQSPSGLQLIGASQRAHRVSIPHHSLESHGLSTNVTANKLSAHFVLKLTPLRICGKLNVYAAWFLRGCSVTGQSFSRHAPGAKRPTLLPL